MPISKIPDYPGFLEIVEDTPITKTVAIAATQVYSGIPQKLVTGYLVRIRSMGTATYVRLGNATAQEYTLKAVGESKAFAAPEGMLVDITNLYTKSDTADAVIEVICTFIPVRHDGNVQWADDAGVIT